VRGGRLIAGYFTKVNGLVLCWLRLPFIGVLSGLAVFDPINFKVNLLIFDYITSSPLAFVVTVVPMKIPSVRR
jgi:hypothetical protein